MIRPIPIYTPIIVPENAFRRFSENRDFGQKLSYDPLWTGPLNVKRSMVNVPTLVIFILLFIYWVGVSCYAFMNGDLKKYFDSIKDSDPNWYLSSSIKALYDVKWFIIGILLFAAMISLLYLVLLRIEAEATVYASLLLLLFTTVLAMCWFGYLLLELRSRDSQILLISIRNSICCIMFLILLIGFISDLTKSMQVDCEIVQELTKAVVFFPSLIIYSVLLYTFLFAMTSVCIATQWSLRSIDGISESFLTINFIIEISCFFWFNCYLSGFFNLIVSGTYGTWYWTRNKSEIPKFTTMKFIRITLRYYMGTSTIGSCIMPVDNGLAQAYMMLHGGNFLESAKNASNLLHRNKQVKKIYEKVYCAITYVWLSLGSISCVLYKALLLFTSTEQSQSSWAQLLVCCIIFFTVSWIFNPLEVSKTTVFVCVLEDFEVNGNSSRPLYMSDKLKMLIPESQTEQ